MIDIIYEIGVQYACFGNNKFSLMNKLNPGPDR